MLRRSRVPRPTFRRPRIGIDVQQVAEAIDAHVALACRLSESDRSVLVDATARFIVDHRWESVDEQPITDVERTVIGANALIPVLRVGGDVYRNVGSIIVRPDPAWSPGIVDDEGASGVISDDEVAVSGEAAPERGPILLAWDHLLEDSRQPEYGENVVIHEFAHKIDMLDGEADGIPPLPRDRVDAWWKMVSQELDRGWSSESALREDAWSNPAEFFAVLTESFVCIPAALQDRNPELYDAMCELLAVDPVAEWQIAPS